MIDINEVIKAPDYDFLRTDEHLKNLIFLTLGGSHAYGTNIEGSDIDIRGVALPSRREVITGDSFEQVLNEPTDTTIYEFRKLMTLLSSCNPNTIELLGCKPEHYIIYSPAAQELFNHKELFLSKKAAASFGGYATAQLRRLDNKSARVLKDEEHEKHILNSIKSAQTVFPEKYFYFPEDSIKLYVDKAVNPEMESEIFIDINLHHYPLRDYKGMWNDMHNVVKDYAKVGKRNNSAIKRNQLSKHMMHLIRLYLMGIDILLDGKIVTYREKEHDFLMEIRNGKYLDELGMPTKEFMDIVDEYENKFNQAKVKSELPEKPDYKKIKDFIYDIIEEYVLN